MVLYAIIGAVSITPGIGQYTKPLVVAVFMNYLPLRWLFGYVFVDFLIQFPMLFNYWILTSELSILWARQLPESFKQGFLIEFILANPVYWSVFMGLLISVIVRIYYPYYVYWSLKKLGFYERLNKALVFS